jgi:hypothetical protein
VIVTQIDAVIRGEYERIHHEHAHEVTLGAAARGIVPFFHIQQHREEQNYTDEIDLDVFEHDKRHTSPSLRESVKR